MLDHINSHRISPELVAAMIAACERANQSLSSPADEDVRRKSALEIIGHVDEGERDPTRLPDLALKRVAPSSAVQCGVKTLTFRTSSRAALCRSRSTGAKAALTNLISAKRDRAKRSFVAPAQKPLFSTPERRGGAIVGLAIAALVPALFWTLLVAGACAMLGASVSTATLLTIGVVIAAFLTLVCAPLLLRPKGAVRRSQFLERRSASARRSSPAVCFGTQPAVVRHVMTDSFIDRLYTDSHTGFVQILEDVMDDLSIDHPEIEDTTLIRREAERALIALFNEGQHDPTVLASYARAHAAWSIRPQYKLSHPIG